MTATFVQAAKNQSVVGVSSIQATFGAGVTAGSFIVVAGLFDRVATGVTVTNGSGDSVTIVDALTDNSSAGIKSFVQAFFTPTAGVTAVTATFSGTQPTYCDLYIWEFSGLSSPTYDKVVHATGTAPGVSPDSGSSGTLSTADQAAIGYGITSAGFDSAGASWSTVAGDGINPNTGSLGEHRTVAATTAINATGVHSATGNWTMHLATFKAGAGPAFGDVLGTLTGTFATSTNPESATGSVVVAIGDLVVVCVGEQTALEVTGASDNLSNTYSAIAAGLDGGTNSVRAFYSRVSTAGTLTSVSAAGIATSANDSVVVAAVYQGPFTSTPLDVAATVANDATTPFACPATGTLAQADELVIGYGSVGTAAAVLAATSPMVMSIQAASSTLIRAAIAAKVVSATTTTTPGFTGTAANASWGTASFRKAALQALTPSLFADTDTFFAPAGGSGLVPALFADTDTFFAPTVGFGAAALTPSLYADTDTFFAPTVAGSGGSSVVTLVFQQAVTTSGGATSRTLSFTCASAVGQERLVALVSITSQAINSPITYSSVQIDGQTATQVGSYVRVADGVDNGPLVSFWRAAGTANTSINVTFDIATGAVFDARGALWTLNNADTLFDSTAATGTAPSGGDINLSLDVDTITNGAVAAAYIAYNNSSGAATWTGLAERYDGIADKLYSGDWFGAADLDVSSGSTPLTVTADLTSSFGSNSAVAGLAVSFNPAASLDASLTPSLYADADTFFAPVVLSLQALFPSLFAGATTVGLGAPLPFLMFTGDTVTGPDTFYSPTVQLSAASNISPSLYSDDETFYAPTVGRGAVSLTPSLYADVDTFYSPVALSSYPLLPSLYADADVFQSPTIQGGAASIQPNTYAEPDTFFSATITRGSVNVAPSLYADADAFFGPVTTSINPLLPAAFSDADVFFSPIVSVLNNLLPTTFVDADTFHSPIIGTLNDRHLFAEHFEDVDIFFVPRIRGGDMGVIPKREWYDAATPRPPITPSVPRS